jgi:hypothetical protein
MRAIGWVLLGVAACSGDDGGSTPTIGDSCDLGAASNEIVVQTPASDCGTRICMHILSNQPDLCTAHCATDDDCVAAVGTACTTSFTCAPVLSVGPFGCEKLCVCSDRVPQTSCP